MGERKCDSVGCTKMGAEHMVGWYWSTKNMCPIVLCPEHGRGFFRPVVVAPPVKETKRKHRESP